MPLEGEVTRLRPIELSDVDRAYRWVNDLEVTEHLAAVYPMSMATEQAWVARASPRQTFADVAFAIEVIESGEHIGSCSLHDVHPVDRRAELGVLIGAKDQWGKGYGFDALRTLLAFAFREMNLRRVMLHRAVPGWALVPVLPRRGGGVPALEARERLGARDLPRDRGDRCRRRAARDQRWSYAT